MKRLIFCFFAFPCFAADIKPTFTLEQAQTIISMSNSEMEKACGKGNCLAAEGILGIVKEIVRAAQESQRQQIPGTSPGQTGSTQPSTGENK